MNTKNVTEKPEERKEAEARGAQEGGSQGQACGRRGARLHEEEDPPSGAGPAEALTTFRRLFHEQLFRTKSIDALIAGVGGPGESLRKRWVRGA
jgi:hypothetical protein